MKLVGFALVAVLAAASPARADDARPRLAIDEPVHDFGTVERGTPVDHTFLLPNRGTASLLVDHVKSSCGCTVAVLSDQVVAPNDEARVAVTLDTSALAGRTTKTITVYTNDPDQPVVGLSLVGEVVTDLVLTPRPLYLGRVRRGERVRREVVVAPGRPGGTYAVESVEHSNPGLRTHLEPRADGPGQRLVVELDPDIPLGRFNETLTLRTTSPREPVITLPVFGSVEGDVVVLPPQVTFGVTRGGTAPEREVHIVTRGARPLAVTRVVVPERVATYTLSPVQEGVEYVLTLRLRDDLPAGKIEGSIEIFTNHPDEGHLVVPLYAIVRDGARRG